VGEYSVGGKSASLVQQSIQKLDEFLQQARSAELRILTTLPTLAEALAATSSKVTTVDAVHADAIARIGLRKLLAGEVADPATLDANYIRRSDAELFSLPRH
jgi:tRNA A37 threonylcarbamoyladenosine modification protein TsaB